MHAELKLVDKRTRKRVRPSSYLDDLEDDYRIPESIFHDDSGLTTVNHHILDYHKNFKNTYGCNGIGNYKRRRRKIGDQDFYLGKLDFF